MARRGTAAARRSESQPGPAPTAASLSGVCVRVWLCVLALLCIAVLLLGDAVAPAAHLVASRTTPSGAAPAAALAEATRSSAATPSPASTPLSTSTLSSAATATSAETPSSAQTPSASASAASTPAAPAGALAGGGAGGGSSGGDGDGGFLLMTGWYGRFSNNMIQLAELVGLALLLNRTLVLPSGARFGALEDVLHLPALDALGVRRVHGGEEGAAAACPALDTVYAVAGVMFNGEQPGYDAVAAGVAAAAPAAVDVVSLNSVRLVPAAGWEPDDGGPAVDAAGAARSEVWHTYPYPLLIDAQSARVWTGAANDGIVVPALVPALLALSPAPRCLALDSLFYVLDWRPVPALFRRVFGAVLAPSPALRAATERLRATPALGAGTPYLALHLRLTDFCVRPGDSEAGGCAPGGFGRWLAPTLAAMLAAPACAAGARTLLILTDAPGSLWVDEARDAAAAAGAAAVSVAHEDAAGAAPNPDAALILVEQELAAAATCFMGASASTFSALIRVRRDIAGAPWETMMPFQYD